ncbi:helix-turn-helix transcriptional regulator [Leucobacter salsicius]|uniref:helix-turn-helix transcriptional regulator n=1 Tax=Leucobacter salsicius TaxID=664638 RepID=UPI0009FE9190|nr:helix-turn-helix transcriptional regulator [Leucobacter salsicius]
MPNRSARSRAVLISQLVGYLEVPGGTLAIGPTASGRSHVLAAVAAALSSVETPYVLIRCSEHVGEETTDADLARDLPPATVLLIDDFELASEELLRSLGQHWAAGGSSLCTIAEQTTGDTYDAVLMRALNTGPTLRRTLESARHVQIPALTDTEVAELIHESSPRMLDSANISSIQALAWGRPGWALDLMQISQSDRISVTPSPAISSVRLSDFSLPYLRSAEGLTSALPLEAVAGATVLSEVDPLTLTGARDLIGAVAVDTLLQHAVLIQTKCRTGLYSVPIIYAASLPRLSSVTIDPMRERAALHLLAQEELGLPLSTSDAFFCTRALQRPDAVTSPQAHEAQASLLHRTAADFIAFGEGGEARALLLRAGTGSGALNPLLKARTATVLSSPLAGLDVLMKNRRPDAQTPTERNQLLGELYLQARLAAEVGLSTENPLYPRSDSLAGPVSRAALEVFTMWNDTSSTDLDTERLHEISVTHEVPEIALAAELLLELELVRNGFLPRRDLTLADLTSRIANSTMHSTVELRDIVATVVLAEGLIVFFLAQHARLGGQLREIISRMPAPHRHVLWANHLLATAEALACGDLDRAQLEWGRFEKRVPRFIPARLQMTISHIGARLRTPEAPITSTSAVHEQVFAYFAGQYDLVSPTQQQLAPIGRRSPGIVSSVATEWVPMLTLAQRHLKAQADDNPAELLRVAAALEERELWGPALTAVSTAHEIFTRRRSSANIARCDEIQLRIAAAAKARLAWFTPPNLATNQRTELTPRELDAAKLAAEGLSNKEIAERMQCSVRTAESHVARARAKLGARNRHDLAERLRAAA